MSTILWSAPALGNIVRTIVRQSYRRGEDATVEEWTWARRLASYSQANATEFRADYGDRHGTPQPHTEVSIMTAMPDEPDERDALITGGLLNYNACYDADDASGRQKDAVMHVIDALLSVANARRERKGVL